MEDLNQNYSLQMTGYEEVPGRTPEVEPQHPSRKRGRPSGRRPREQTVGKKSLDKIYSMSDEPDRRVFLDHLIKFMEEIGTPLVRPPKLVNTLIDLYRLYRIIQSYGGLVHAQKTVSWSDTALQLGFTDATREQAAKLKLDYIVFLLPYEAKFDRGGVDPESLVLECQAVSRTHQSKLLNKRKENEAGVKEKEKPSPPPVEPGSIICEFCQGLEGPKGTSLGKFNLPRDLRRHIRRMHPGMPVPSTAKTPGEDEEEFLDEDILPRGRGRPAKKPAEKPPPPLRNELGLFVCEICRANGIEKALIDKGGLQQHKRLKHPHATPVTDGYACREEGCHFRSLRPDKMVAHLADFHKLPGFAVSEELFRSRKELYDWKMFKLELTCSAMFYFPKKYNFHKIVDKHPTRKAYCFCNPNETLWKSGQPKSRQELVRRSNCPAFITENYYPGQVTAAGTRPERIEVQYCFIHYGHDSQEDLAHVQEQLRKLRNRGPDPEVVSNVFVYDDIIPRRNDDESHDTPDTNQDSFFPFEADAADSHMESENPEVDVANPKVNILDDADSLMDGADPLTGDLYRESVEIHQRHANILLALNEISSSEAPKALALLQRIERRVVSARTEAIESKRKTDKESRKRKAEEAERKAEEARRRAEEALEEQKAMEAKQKADFEQAMRNARLEKEIVKHGRRKAATEVWKKKAKATHFLLGDGKRFAYPGQD